MIYFDICKKNIKDSLYCFGSLGFSDKVYIYNYVSKCFNGYFNAGDIIGCAYNPENVEYFNLGCSDIEEGWTCDHRNNIPTK